MRLATCHTLEQETQTCNGFSRRQWSVYNRGFFIGQDGCGDGGFFIFDVAVLLSKKAGVLVVLSVSRCWAPHPRALTGRPKLIHFPGQVEWVWCDEEEMPLCRPLCGSEEEAPIGGDSHRIVTCQECRSLCCARNTRESDVGLVVQ